MMNNHVFFILLVVVLVWVNTTTVSSLSHQPVVAEGVIMNKKCIQQDRNSLLDFKSHLQDPRGRLSTWTAEEEEDDCCKWNGVTCNNQTGHVTELYLFGYYLEGEISPSLFNLTYLTHLEIGWNSFHGTIPRSIGSLTELRYLDLLARGGDFGSLAIENLDWLSHLSCLEALYMDGISLAKANNWVNVILSLPRLLELSLSDCDLSQVMHPYSSSSINSSSSSSNIVFLDLSHNNLNSSMYHWLFPLTSNKLVQLSLSYNTLDGIPKYLGNLCSLKTLYLADNYVAVSFSDFLNKLSGCTSLTFQELYATGSQFTGSLSDEIQQFSSLKYLYLSHNQLNGSISEKVWELPKLQYLDLSSNSLRGPISQNIGNSKSFYINLSRNNFSGGISFLCRIVSGSLSYLDLSNNSLSGQIPDCLWHFKNLRVLNLGHNYLSGRLPASVKSMINLEGLYLNNNEFSGELPLSLKNCQKLTFLDLGANMFSGNVPVWIGENLSGLYALILRSNNFLGPIPLQLCQLINLQILDLSMNNLYGTIPSCVNNLTALVKEGFLSTQNVHEYASRDELGSGKLFRYTDHAMFQWQGNLREFSTSLGLLKSIDLSSNNLKGKIPYELTDLHGLLALNLSKNILSGEIPRKIGQLKKLLTLDLSRNMFSGEMPSSMSELTLLNYLDVSYNNLSGRVPSSTQLQSFEPQRFEGNAGLCGPPMTNNCTIVGESESECDGKKIDELQRWFNIGGATGFPIGFWIVCSSLLLNRRGRHAFFNFVDNLRDWVYVKVTVFFAKFEKLEEA